MQELNARPATDDLRTLDDAETAGVSGAEVKIDMGLFGILILGRCVSWENYTVNDDGGVSWTSIGHCPA